LQDPLGAHLNQVALGPRRLRLMKLKELQHRVREVKRLNPQSLKQIQDLTLILQYQLVKMSQF
jgi:hypothetical protein